MKHTPPRGTTSTQVEILVRQVPPLRWALPWPWTRWRRLNEVTESLQAIVFLFDFNVDINKKPESDPGLCPQPRRPGLSHGGVRWADGERRSCLNSTHSARARPRPVEDIISVYIHIIHILFCVYVCMYIYIYIYIYIHIYIYMYPFEYA